MPFTHRDDAQIIWFREQEKHTWPSIGYRLRRSRDVVSKRYKHLKSIGMTVEDARPYISRSLTFDGLLLQWNEWLERTIPDIREIRHEPVLAENLRYIGIIGDTHCPYEDLDVIAAFLADGPYDVIIHSGDLLDWHAVSSFVHRKHVDPKEEIQHGTALLTLLSDNAVQVHVVDDNHGKRLLKTMMKSNLPTALVDLMQLFSPQLNLFKLMAKDLPNVQMTQPVKEIETARFFGQWGDLVVGHADTTSTLQLRAAENLNKWLTH